MEGHSVFHPSVVVLGGWPRSGVGCVAPEYHPGTTDPDLPLPPTPVLQKEYKDQLWFEKAEGTFCVDLRATLPCHNLICPPSLQLPMCAMGDMAEAWFSLDNVG